MLSAAPAPAADDLAVDGLGRPTAKSKRTRTHVLNEAVRLASRVGLGGLSFGTLAEQSGISKSGLFAHFRSKEELQIATLELAASQFVERVLAPVVTATPRGVPRIRAFFDAWLVDINAGILQGGDVLIGSAFEFDDAPDGPVRDAVVRGHRAMYSAIERMVRIAIDEGHLHADTDPSQFAFEFLGIVHAYHHERRLLGGAQPARHAQAMLERTLRGYAA